MDETSLLGEAIRNPFIFALLTVVVLASFVSERAAKIAGPLGAAGRWWGDRQLRRVKREAAVDAARKAVRDETVLQLRAEVAALAADVKRLTVTVENRESRIVALELWAFNARSAAAKVGLDLASLPLHG